MTATVEDIRVFVETPKGLKPTLPWGELLQHLILPSNLPRIVGKGSVNPCQPEKLLNAVGSAITDERLASGIQIASQIYTPETKFRVLSTVNRVLFQLSLNDSGAVQSAQVHEIVENALLEEGESLAAKGYLLYRTQKQLRKRSLNRLSVIRRNGRRVQWDPDKILNAINKVFIAERLEDLDAEDELPKSQILDKSVEVADRVIHEIAGRNKDVIHIEEIQDIIEKTLEQMEYIANARRYNEYRVMRHQHRQEQQEKEKEFHPEMVTPNLMARIDFASIDLKLPLDRKELAKRLVYSMGSDLNSTQQAHTVLLNARQLIELNPSFRYFTARILLTYIYEEVLPWKIEDGVGALQKVHTSYFEKTLEREIELELVNPELRKFDIRALAKRINPLADLHFDFLGIQTLYDRYLQHEREAEIDGEVLVLDKSRKKRLETPQYMWMRVAMGLSLNEKEREEAAMTFYSLYTTKRFCSGTPTLFNSGTIRSQLSSCYGLTASDELSDLRVDKEGNIYPSGIFGTVTNCAQLSKYAGGLGVDFTRVRGVGSHIKGTNGESLGIVPFLKIFNDTMIAVNQGGKRRGVACVYLETWHNDIEEFLDLRKNTGDDRRRCHDLHLANWIPDLFFIRAIKGQDWTLFRSSDVLDLHETYGSEFKKRYEYYESLVEKGELYGKKVRASQLWKKMLNALFETGHPWITFKDPCNIRSPQDHVGVIHNSNLCTEITLNDSDDEHFVCNLGSINISRFVNDKGEIDYKDLAESVHTAVRMLDNVVDINFYPTKPAENANKRHRPVGLGMMGWQDLLHKLKIPFESEEMIQLADELMEFICWHAYSASCELAKLKGAYSTFKGSKWDRGLLPLDTLSLLEQERGVPVDVSRTSKMPWDELRADIKKYGMRNSNVVSIAPTASISNIMGCSPCIEPDYRHLFTKSNLSGEFVWLNPYLIESLQEEGLWNLDMLEDLKYYKGDLEKIESIPSSIKKQFKTAFNIEQQWLLKGAAARQKWIDQAQSTNLFLAEPDQKKMSIIYLTAWKMGLKTTYYLKNKSASDIEDATIDIRRKKSEMEKEDTGEQPVIKACRIDDPECESCQ